MNRVTGALAVVALWVLLFGDLNLANVLGGLAVAGVVFVLFPRRPGRARHRCSPWGCARLVADLAVQLVLSSARVALAVLAPTPARLQTAVVRVPLRSDSDLVATVIADLITLTPGTLTLDVRRDPDRLLVHVLGESDPASVVASVQRLEDRVLHAIRPQPAPTGADPGGARS
jgi:multicomponent Na+:H+ antiporter subunit E